MKPLIGITPDFQEPEDAEKRYFLYERYPLAVSRAGGVPLILPFVEEPGEVALIFDRIDGLMITGGAFDIDPAHYGEQWAVKEGCVKEVRTRCEMAMAREALRRDLPVLGICGGEQTINVILRGTLYQDILSQKEGAFDHERKEETGDAFHSVAITPGTLLHRIVGEEVLRVNSSHHQAVREAGDGVVVNARAEDGVIEGIESIRHTFVLGVQWHPECLIETDSADRCILEALVGAGRRFGSAQRGPGSVSGLKD